LYVNGFRFNIPQVTDMKQLTRVIKNRCSCCGMQCNRSQPIPL